MSSCIDARVVTENLQAVMQHFQYCDAEVMQFLQGIVFLCCKSGGLGFFQAEQRPTLTAPEYCT